MCQNVRMNTNELAARMAAWAFCMFVLLILYFIQLDRTGHACNLQLQSA
jgi:hypothetical protein